jgi:hypothetical protein
MSEISQEVRFASDRQLIVTEQVKRIFLFGNTTVDGTYKNITVGLETVKMGQVMGKVAATGKWVICKSAATDGSAVPRAVSPEEITDATAAQEVLVSLIDGGEINKAGLVFDGTDTLDTLVGGVRMEDLLIANSRSLSLKTITDTAGFGNY